MSKPLDPNAPATSGSGIFGLPFAVEESDIVYIPVSWEVTTSYGGGTARAPQSILQASAQVDLYDTDVIDPYKSGLHMIDESKEILALNKKNKLLAKKVIHAIEKGKPVESLGNLLKPINQASKKLNTWVFDMTKSLIKIKKIPVIVGGDHSTPFGAIQAYGEYFPGFGILHFDAHLDLRDEYEGFEHSHASIMRNVCDQIPAVKKIVQVGIRDFCQEEVNYTLENKNKIKVFYDYNLKQAQYAGIPWKETAQEIVSKLPNLVYISFDIDGLDPKLCPNTGTPVPGGLELDQSLEIVREIIRQKKKIIGFDLCEVSPGKTEWDANVGARLLYKLSALTLASQGKRPLRSRV
ncbi:MAG: agmatinase family protein [Xanthomonadaceae bacterium]|nr:agmatinase family protein [Xanthomonadaceae bacterium]